MIKLVTGFEPFGASKVNTSELVVTTLAALGEPGVDAGSLHLTCPRAPRQQAASPSQARGPGYLDQRSKSASSLAVDE